MPSTSAIDIPLSLEMAKLRAKRANVAFKIILPTMGKRSFSLFHLYNPLMVLG